MKSIATELDAAVYIGKEDLTEGVIEEINMYLAAHEIVKVKIQEGSILNPKETANICAQKLGAEFVQAIGRKFVLYRPAAEEEKRKIVLP